MLLWNVTSFLNPQRLRIYVPTPEQAGPMTMLVITMNALLAIWGLENLVFAPFASSNVMTIMMWGMLQLDPITVIVETEVKSYANLWNQKVNSFSILTSSLLVYNERLLMKHNSVLLLSQRLFGILEFVNSISISKIQPYFTTILQPFLAIFSLAT